MSQKVFLNFFRVRKKKNKTKTNLGLNPNFCLSLPSFLSSLDTTDGSKIFSPFYTRAYRVSSQLLTTEKLFDRERDRDDDDDDDVRDKNEFVFFFFSNDEETKRNYM